MWLNAARHASEPGAELASFIDWRQLPVLTDAVQAGGWTWRNVATWWKPGVRMQKGRFSASAEYVIYATNGPAVDGQGSPQNVFSWKIDDDRDHIAQKPAEVMRWVMQVVPAGVVVLDPFMGSGSTLRAAKDCGHRAIGIEKLPGLAGGSGIW
jgi:site-specific DNA-methyltransferase (adenine-specific)